MGANKRIAVNSVILFVRMVITTIVGLISSRIVLQSLGESNYGLYAVVGGIVIMLNILNTAMISTTYRYIAFEQGKKDGNVNRIFNISLVIHICMALVILGLAELLGIWYIRNHLNIEPDKLSSAIFVFRISVITVLFSILIVPFQGLITAFEKFGIRALIETIRSLIKLGLVVFLIYYSGDKLRLYAIIMLFVTIIPSLMFYFYCYKKHYNEIRWNFQRKWSLYVEMLKYSFWILFGTIASIGKTQGSALVINSFFGTVINASFGLASQLNSYIVLFSRNIAQVAIPQITKNYSGGNEKRSYNLVCHISKYTFFLMLLVSVPLLLKMEFILELWLGEIPVYTVELSRLIIINSLFETLGYGLFSLIAATGKITWFQITTSTMLLIGLPIAYFLYKLGYPPYYISVIYIFIAIVLIIAQLMILKRVTKVKITKILNISYKHVLFVCIMIAPSYIVSQQIEDSLVGFIALGGICTIWILLSVYIVGLNKTEKEYILQILKKTHTKYIKKLIH